MSKVLVVDDTPSELQLITLYLTESGFNVVSATDAKEALIKAAELKPYCRHRCCHARNEWF
jgi:two-component system, chemotaxis family, response regulator PixH